MAFDTLLSLPDQPLSLGQPAVATEADWPTHGLVDDLLPVLEGWLVVGQGIALATLLAVDGSAPRPVGSHMLVRADGAIAGYVSGGCVEGAIAAEAAEMLARGEASRFLRYGPGSPNMDVRLTCGGAIGILVVSLDALALAHAWRAAREARQVLWLSLDSVSGGLTWQAGAPPADEAFHRPLPPPLRLVLAGSDPVTLALATLAPAFGLDVHLLRPLGPPALPPGVMVDRYDTRPIETALDAVGLDAFTAVYTLTHDTDTDHTVLSRALASEAFCVGALGSRRRMADERVRLRGDGLPEETLHAPAGLDLGRSDSPRQIALSILAEVTALRPRLTAGFGAGAIPAPALPRAPAAS